MAFVNVEVEAAAGHQSIVARGHKTWIKVILCCAISVPVLYLLSKQVGTLEGAALYAAIDAIPLTAIFGSIFFTAISFAAVARYDEMAIRMLGLPVPQGAAIRNGFVATSLSQCLGVGFLTGTLARWRLYRGFGVSPAQTAMISGIVIVGFMTGFGAILAVLTAISPGGLAGLLGADVAVVRAVAIGLSVLTATLLVLTLCQPRIVFLGRQIKLPPAALFARQIALAGCDVVPAALAFWMLLPAELAPSALAIIPVYLTALGLGLLSNTPGGVGVLELTCLVALPFIPAEQLVAALIVHRLIYFIAPALVGGSLLILRELRGETVHAAPPVEVVPAAPRGQVPDKLAPLLSRSARAETGLAYLGDKDFLLSDCGQGGLMIARSGNSLVALGDPIGPRHLWPELVAMHQEAARDRFLSPSFYRVNSAFAQILVRAGCKVQQIGMEGMVPLANFSTEGSSKRELRRKIRNADKAGVEIATFAPGDAPLGAYVEIAREWDAAKAGARGFSMGLFDTDYLSRFTIYEARVDNRVVALLSVWVSGDGGEWSLDVMRNASDAPDGTMHALVAQAIADAKAAGAHGFSLCAVPFGGVEGDGPVERLVRWLYDKKPEWHGSHGLYRFKNAFRPDWTPCYGASEGWGQFAVAALDTKRLVMAPAT